MQRSIPKANKKNAQSLPTDHGEERQRVAESSSVGSSSLPAKFHNDPSLDSYNSVRRVVKGFDQVAVSYALARQAPPVEVISLPKGTSSVLLPPTGNLVSTEKAVEMSQPMDLAMLLMHKTSSLAKWVEEEGMKASSKDDCSHPRYTLSRNKGLTNR